MEEVHSLELLFLSGLKIVAGRVCRVKDLSIERMAEVFDTMAVVVYIVSEERSRTGTDHIHIMVGYHPEYLQASGETGTELLSKQIKRAFPDASGNKCIYTKMAVKPKQLIKYTLKEGQFLQKGFSNQFINDSKSLSKSKDGMVEKFNDLEERLILKIIPFDRYMARYVDLKVAHGQNLYDSHLIAYFKRMAIQTGSLDRDAYVDTLYAKVFNVV